MSDQNNNPPNTQAPQDIPVEVPVDIPPPPQSMSGIPQAQAQTAPPPASNPNPILDIPPVVTPPPKLPKLGGKKFIGAVLGLLLLVGGIGAGVLLVQQQQDIRERASGKQIGDYYSTLCSGVTAGAGGCVPNNYTCTNNLGQMGCPTNYKCGVSCTSNDGDGSVCRGATAGAGGCVPSAWSCVNSYGQLDCPSGEKCGVSCTSPSPSGGGGTNCPAGHCRNGDGTCSAPGAYNCTSSTQRGHCENGSWVYKDDSSCGTGTGGTCTNSQFNCTDRCCNGSCWSCGGGGPLGPSGCGYFSSQEEASAACPGGGGDGGGTTQMGRIQGRVYEGCPVVGGKTGTVTVAGVGSYDLTNLHRGPNNNWVGEGNVYSTNDILPMGNSYDVSFSAASGYNIEYSYCQNSIQHDTIFNTSTTKCSTWRPGSSVRVQIPTTNAPDYYTGYVDLYWRCVQGSNTSTVPDCTNLTLATQGANINSLQVGQTYTFNLTAGGTAPITDVELAVRNTQNCTSQKPWTQKPGQAGTHSFTWTPSQAGSYIVYGKVWNDGIAECRAECVDGPPRYLCQSAASCKLTATVVGANTAAPYCQEIKAYDTNWVQIPTSELSNLKAGDKVRFVVKGFGASGSFTKAAFRINNAYPTQADNITATRPGTTDEFYYEYTIPATTRTFSILGHVYHSTNVWIPARSAQLQPTGTTNALPTVSPVGTPPSGGGGGDTLPTTNPPIF